MQKGPDHHEEELNSNQGISKDQVFINKLTATVEVNLKNDQFGVEELASNVGYSRSQIHRKLKAITGKSVSQFIREYRLERAFELLSAEVGTASEVAYLVGFSSASYFNKCFHEFYGHTPMETKKTKERVIENSETSYTSDEPLKYQAGHTSTNHSSKWILFGVIFVLTAFFLVFWEKDENELMPQKEPSIAVLPFKNISENEENQFFIDGVMDAILTDLVQVGQFKVISRTSVEKYRHINKAIPEIAKELNVTHILEGSAQRNGNRIRIIVQLIDAKEDNHLWAKTYDRELTDVFSVQSEISKLVATELKVEIVNHPEAKNFYQSDNLAAYDFFLKGAEYHKNYFFRRTEKDLQLAADLYMKAMKLDSNFVGPQLNLGWVFVDRVRMLKEDPVLYDSALLIAHSLNDKYPNRPYVLTLLGSAYRFKGANTDEAKKILIRSVVLNSNNSWALDLLGWYFAFEENRRDLALLLHERAIAIDPFNATLHEAMGWHWLTLNKYEESEAAFAKAIEIQPDLTGAYLGMGSLQIQWNGDYSKGLGFFEEALSFSPNNNYVFHQLALFSSWHGDFKKSAKYFKEMIGDSNPYIKLKNSPWMPGRYAYTRSQLEGKESADPYFDQELQRDIYLVENSIRSTEFSPYYELAATHAYLGNIDESFHWLTKILEDNRWGVPSYLAKDPLFNSIRGDVRMKQYIEEYTKRSALQIENHERLSELTFSEVLKEF